MATAIPFRFGISTNGRFVLFESDATNLVANDTNNAQDIFVRDLVNGTTTLVSVNTNGWSGSGESRDPAMTPDGRYVAFISAANDLVPGDTNGIPDIFVRDLQSNTTTLVSVGATSTSSIFPTGSSEMPEITPDGRYIAFYSYRHQFGSRRHHDGRNLCTRFGSRKHDLGQRQCPLHLPIRDRRHERGFLQFQHQHQWAICCF